MGKLRGFVEIGRKDALKRPAPERIADFDEVEGSVALPVLRDQASRCMDCGIPFCHKGCPLGNRIPDWNDLVYRDRWRAALDQLHATNNFPEFTGKTCPAPCEEACVLNINDAPVTIKQIEKQIIEHGWEHGWVAAMAPKRATGKKIAVVGSGPAGLACAQQLARAGHAVTVYERSDRLGGLLRYGIPDFKMHKSDIDRRIEQMRGEGVTFEVNADVGGTIAAEQLRSRFDAVCLATGAQKARELPVPGRDLRGVELAMPYLEQQNRVVAGDEVKGQILATAKRVVILGGGDTGADCLGTAHRQRAAEVHHFHYKPAPPEMRTADMPWPWWPMILRDSSSHEEGGVRGWGVVAKAFTGDAVGNLRAMHCVHVDWQKDEQGRARMVELPSSETTIEVDLVLLAIGFEGTDAAVAVSGFGAELTEHGTALVDARFATGARGVFACGDAVRGPSLVVWAIWEGRQAAYEIDTFLMGKSELPVSPNPLPL